MGGEEGSEKLREGGRGGTRIKRERHQMPAAYYNAAMPAGNMQSILRTSKSLYCCTYD